MNPYFIMVKQKLIKIPLYYQEYFFNFDLHKYNKI